MAIQARRVQHTVNACCPRPSYGKVAKVPSLWPHVRARPTRQGLAMTATTYSPASRSARALRSCVSSSTSSNEHACHLPLRRRQSTRTPNDDHREKREKRETRRHRTQAQQPCNARRADLGCEVCRQCSSISKKQFIATFPEALTFQPSSVDLGSSRLLGSCPDVCSSVWYRRCMQTSRRAVSSQAMRLDAGYTHGHTHGQVPIYSTKYLC